VNSKSNFDLVFDKCKEIINDLIVSKLNNLNIVTAILEVILVIITLGIAYISKYIKIYFYLYLYYIY